MNKAKFYQNISTYFNHAVRGYACGAKNLKQGDRFLFQIKWNT